MSRFHAVKPLKLRIEIRQIAQEKTDDALVPLFRLRANDSAPAAQRGSWIDLDVSAYPFAAGRIQLPPRSDLLGLWRRGALAFRIMGGRMDDAGASATLPTLGHVRDRQRDDGITAESTLVSAVALRALARHERASKPSR